MLVALTLVFTFSICAYAFSSDVTYYTTDLTHSMTFELEPYYLRDYYDWGGPILPGDDCSVQGWAQTSSGKCARVEVSLTDENGETYSGSTQTTNGTRVTVHRQGNDDIAQKGVMKSTLYIGSTKETAVQHKAWMTVDDRDN